MLQSEIVNPNITPLYLWGFRAYISPTHFVWTTIRFTKKLSVNCQHKGHESYIRHHYTKSLTVNSCNLT